MSTPWFDKLDRADDWLAKVTSSVRHRVMDAGHARWNAPANAQARERAARLTQRAHARVGTEVRTLAEAGVRPLDTMTRLRDRAEDRAARTLARYRNPRPSGRATR